MLQNVDFKPQIFYSVHDGNVKKFIFSHCNLMFVKIQILKYFWQYRLACVTFGLGTYSKTKIQYCLCVIGPLFIQLECYVHLRVCWEVGSEKNAYYEIVM